MSHARSPKPQSKGTWPAQPPQPSAVLQQETDTLGMLNCAIKHSLISLSVNVFYVTESYFIFLLQGNTLV